MYICISVCCFFNIILLYACSGILDFDVNFLPRALQGLTMWVSFVFNCADLDFLVFFFLLCRTMHELGSCEINGNKLRE